MMKWQILIFVTLTSILAVNLVSAGWIEDIFGDHSKKNEGTINYNYLKIEKQWVLKHSTDKDFDKVISDKRNKNTLICLETNKSEYKDSLDKNIYDKNKELKGTSKIEKSNKDKKQDKYSYCFNTDGVSDYYKIGEQSSEFSYEDVFNYEYSWGNTSISLICDKGTPDLSYVFKDGEWHFTAEVNGLENKELTNCRFSLDSTSELVFLEQPYTEPNSNYSFTYPIYYNYYNPNENKKLVSDNEIRHNYIFKDICSKNYSNCTFDKNNIYFTTGKDIDPVIQLSSTCTTLDNDDTEYIMTQNITFVSGTCFSVTGNNVTIDSNSSWVMFKPANPSGTTSGNLATISTTTAENKIFNMHNVNYFIVSAQQNANVLNLPGTDGNFWIKTNISNNYIFRNSTFGAGSNNFILGTGYFLVNSTIENNTVLNMTAIINANFKKGSNNNMVRRNTLINGYYGFLMTLSNSTVRDNFVNGTINYGVGITSTNNENVSYINNTFKNIRTAGIYASSTGSGGKTTYFINNTLESATQASATSYGSVYILTSNFYFSGNNITGLYGFSFETFNNKNITILTDNIVNGNITYYNDSISDYIYDETTSPNATMVWCYHCRNITVKNMKGITPNYAGILFYNTSESFIENVRIDTVNPNRNRYSMLFIDSDNNTIKDSYFNGASSSFNILFSGTSSTNNTFLNTTYTTSSLSAGSTIYRKWYYQAYVNDSLGNPLENANVTFQNLTGGNPFNLTTNSSGWTNLINLTEYYQIAGSLYYSSPYTVRTYYSDYAPDVHSLTANTNKLEYITISPDVNGPTITIYYPTNKTYSSLVVAMNYSVIDNVAVDSCWYSTDGGLTNNTAPNCANITGLISSVGSNTWTIWSNDSKNNINSSSVVFSIDLSRLTISLVYPISDIEVGQYSWNNITVNITCLNYNCGDVNVTLDPLKVSGVVNTVQFGLFDTTTNLTAFGVTTGDFIYWSTGYFMGQCTNITTGPFYPSWTGNWYLNIAGSSNLVAGDQFSIFDTQAECLGGLSDSKDGIMPMNSGHPFYTNNSNPRTINLSVNESKLVSFLYYANTTKLDYPFTFFVDVNKTAFQEISNTTNRINITVTDCLPPSNDLNWNINCSHNCVINQTQYIYNNITWTGSGNITLINDLIFKGSGKHYSFYQGSCRFNQYGRFLI